MKAKFFLVWIAVGIFAWMFFFQGAQEASSSPLMRITVTPSATTARSATLPPPITRTGQPLIPVTGAPGSAASVDLLVTGGLVLLVLGVVGLAWPARRAAK